MFSAQQQFFPTPQDIAWKVWWKAKGLANADDRSRVFDPSAGKGDLLDSCRTYAKGGFAVEIDPDLQAILREKGHKVLGSDFLSWNEPLEFDVVVMNPPFNRGVDHVLHAWNFVAEGGALVALLNQESIENLCSSERQRLSLLVQEYGGWESLGQCFKDAERRTDVTVAMVWLKKPRRELDPSEFQFSGSFRTDVKIDSEAFTASPLALSDAVDNLVAQYNACLNVLRARAKAQEELDYHLGSIGPSHDPDRYDMKRTGELFKDVAALKYRFWWGVFNLSKMSEVKTSGFAAKFKALAESQVDMAFDRENIMIVLGAFAQNREQIMLDSLVSVFDRATEYHESNKVHREGWKSNSGWKVNQKIVIPCGTHWNKSVGWWEFDHRSRHRCFLNDFEHVLAWVSGVTLDKNHQTIADKINYSKLPAGEWIECRFFDIKLFYKGTIHIRFRDLYLLEDFNLLAARGKKWIGGEGF